MIPAKQYGAGGVIVWDRGIYSPDEGHENASVTVFWGTQNERHRYLLANNLATLLWLGRVGTLEFHVCHSRAQRAPEALGARTDYASSLESSILNFPDYLVFDIDPYIYSGKEARGDEPELNKRGFAVGKRVAFWLRGLLREMSLEAIVKTSGKTGLHVFVPIARTVNFDEPVTSARPSAGTGCASTLARSPWNGPAKRAPTRYSSTTT